MKITYNIIHGIGLPRMHKDMNGYSLPQTQEWVIGFHSKITQLSEFMDLKENLINFLFS